ncbi:CRISPR-associated Cas6 family protein [Hydrogenispora ethanolica]|uniref:CRISPR-associated endoribonuclease n=1 Tax=Hydrogenispora ethanolica TaxID=1082276 RepID=A0A4R1QQM3_HYDET|nr:CRISPR-associated endoribonuclease Cas6 [Hydrogenispora ethanolica]TCL54665.1 CRISPR-associated Cas6 family protein [Hydrogenispora ethanolica]
MRLKISFNSDAPIDLPVQYNHWLQATLYASLDPEFGAFLHDRGFDGGGRVFKLFTFSRLFGTFRINGPQISFTPPLQLIVASPVERFCQSLLNGLLTKGEIRLGENRLVVESVQAEHPVVEGESLKLHLLSPVTVYSTLLRRDGRKYTCYFAPGDPEFTRLAKENLDKKFRALVGTEPSPGIMTIHPLRLPRLHILDYKGNVIKAYSGMLQMNGPRELLQLAIDAGLGSKNGMGFGCGEIKG